MSKHVSLEHMSPGKECHNPHQNIWSKLYSLFHLELLPFFQKSKRKLRLCEDSSHGQYIKVSCGNSKCLLIDTTLLRIPYREINNGDTLCVHQSIESNMCCKYVKQNGKLVKQHEIYAFCTHQSYQLDIILYAYSIKPSHEQF